MKLCLLPITDYEHYVSMIRYDFLRIYDSSPKNQDEIQPKYQDFGDPQATAYFDIQVHKNDLNQGLCQKKALFLYNYTQCYFTKTWNLRMGKWQRARSNMEFF